MTRLPRLPHLLLTTAAIAALLAACGGADETADPLDPADGSTDEAAEDDEDTVPDDGAQPETNGDAIADPSGAFSGQVGIAFADAAAHFDVDPGDIEVVAAEAVTWPDGAIGCPEPDMMYTQALVDGYRILLSVDGDEIAYHGEDGGDPRRCDDPSDPVS